MLCHGIIPYIFIRYVSSVVDCYVFYSGIYGWMKLGSASKITSHIFLYISWFDIKSPLKKKILKISDFEKKGQNGTCPPPFYLLYYGYE
jgi:hypothetical protein